VLGLVDVVAAQEQNIGQIPYGKSRNPEAARP
jgi:hypothetical protein